MSIVDELRPASFRGLPFLVRSSSISRGGKSVTHEYPNDDRRYVEGLGILKPTITLQAIISGDDYTALRDLLCEALDDTSIGILVHPWQGNLRVVPKPYTVEETDAAVGECIINMLFEVADPPINPRQTTDQLSFISSLANQLDSGLVSRITNTFKVSREYIRNFTAAKLKITNLISEFNVFSGYFGASNNTNALKSSQADFTSNIVNSINTPFKLADNLSSIFDASNSVNDDPSATFSGMQSLFSFGDNDNYPSIVTRETSERSTNTAVLNAATQAYALIYSYQNAVQIEYTNEEQVARNKAILEQQYHKLYNDVIAADYDLTFYDVLGDEVMDTLESMRNSCRLAFEQISINVDKIVTVDVQISVPATILAYQYYGNVDNAEEIVDLNSIADVTFIKSNQKLLVNADDNV
jgi:prophage DNA circulation protein